MLAPQGGALDDRLFYSKESRPAAVIAACLPDATM